MHQSDKFSIAESGRTVQFEEMDRLKKALDEVEHELL